MTETGDRRSTLGRHDGSGQNEICVKRIDDHGMRGKRFKAQRLPVPFDCNEVTVY